MTISFGSIVILALIIAVIIIGSKVKNQSRQLAELQKKPTDE
jgi:hypothetical protein